MNEVEDVRLITTGQLRGLVGEAALAGLARPLDEEEWHALSLVGPDEQPTDGTHLLTWAQLRLASGEDVTVGPLAIAAALWGGLPDAGDWERAGAVIMTQGWDGMATIAAGPDPRAAVAVVTLAARVIATAAVAYARRAVTGETPSPGEGEADDDNGGAQ